MNATTGAVTTTTTERTDEAFSRDAMKALLHCVKDIEDFEGEDHTQKRAWTWLCDTRIALNIWSENYPTSRTGITDRTVLNNIRDKFKGASQHGWITQQFLHNTVDNMEYFWYCFSYEYIPASIKRLILDQLEFIVMSRFNRFTAFLNEWNRILNELALLQAVPSDPQLFDMATAAMDDQQTLTDTLVTQRCTTYAQVQVHWERIKRSETTIELVRSRQQALKGQRKSSGQYNNMQQDDASTSDNGAGGVDDHFGMMGEETYAEFGDPFMSDAADEVICYAIRETGDDNLYHQFSATIRGRCAQCNKEGHFIRDCPSLGGTGQSKVGQRYGTAVGFKEGDDPSKRPDHYKKARAQRDKRMSERLTSAKRMPIKSKHKGGKNATYARRLKTGNATNPSDKKYLSRVALAKVFNMAAEAMDSVPEEDSFDMGTLRAIMGDHPDEVDNEPSTSGQDM